MKRFFYLFLLMILFIPIISLADSSGPSILGYDAVVTNKKGAKVSDSNDVIPYNTKVHVYDEAYIKDDNKKYASVCYINEDNCGRWTRYILLSDIMPQKEVITPNDIKGKFDENGYGEETYFYKETHQFIVFEENGIKLSKGPSDIYAKYDSTIKYMTNLISTYVLHSGGGEDSTSYEWYYIDDGSNKGWLKLSSKDATTSSSYAIGELTNKMLVVMDTKLYAEDGSVALTIPSETVLDKAYYIRKQKEYFVKYEDKEGYTKGDSFSVLVDGFILVVRDTKIISSDGKEKGTIPLGTKIKDIYGDYTQYGRDDYGICGVKGFNNKKYYYVKYNGIKGFILEEDTMSFIANGESLEKQMSSIEKSTMTFNENVAVHEYTNEPYYVENPLNNRIIKTISSGTSVVCLYIYDTGTYDAKNNYVSQTIYLINDNGTLGWVVTEEKAVINNNDNPVDDNSYTIPKENSSIWENSTILYAIIGAVIISITAVVTIILVNKNKKNKKELPHDTKEPIKKEDSKSEQDKVAANEMKDKLPVKEDFKPDEKTVNNVEEKNNSSNK